MIATFVLALREGLEAALVVGIVLGYLKKTGQNEFRWAAWAGVLAAVACSVALAAVIQVVGAELEGRAEEIFEGTMMALAVIVLTWMIFWMRYQSRTLKSTLEREIQQRIAGNEGRGLMAVTFFAVFREGLETALFLSAAAFAANESETLVGAVVGLAVATLVGYVTYASSVRLNLSMFFNVTSVLLLVFAAGLLAHGIHEFQEAGLLPIFTESVWDTNTLLDEDSTVGQLLKAVLGYNANPSLLEVIGYWAYWGLVLFGMPWLVDRRLARTLAPA